MRDLLLGIVLLSSFPLAARAQVVNGPPLRTENTFHGNPFGGSGTAEWSTDPVVGERRNGQKYDVRTGEPMSDAQVADAEEREALADGPSGPRVIFWTRADPYEQALWQAGDEDANVAFGKATANETYSAAFQGGVASAAYESENRLALLEAHGEHEIGLVEGSRGKAALNLAADGMVGSEMTVTGAANVKKRAAWVNGGVDALAGARVTCEISPEAILCGLQIAYTASPEAAAGYGASVGGYFGYDFAQWKIKAGGKAAVVAGVGFGVEQEIEIDLQALVNDPKAVKDCLEGAANDALDKAKYVVRDVIVARAKEKLVEFLYEWGRRSGDAGSNVGRFADTVPGSGGGARGDPGPSRTAGVRR